MYIYSLDNDTIGDVKHTISKLSREPTVLQYSPDGAYLAIGDAGKNVVAHTTTDYEVNFLRGGGGDCAMPL